MDREKIKAPLTEKGKVLVQLEVLKKHIEDNNLFVLNSESNECVISDNGSINTTLDFTVEGILKEL